MISEEDRLLELILQYSMNEIETKAFKIALLYLEKSKMLFPNYQHYRLPKGDPRKSDLFRQCHKLVRTKDDKIEDEDYKLYVHAQLDILKHIKKGETHPIILPSCLAGDKAWKRWLLWKGKYDKMIETKMSAGIASTISVQSADKIKKSLWKTKQFFLAWFDKLDKKDILDSLNDRNIFRWYQTGNVSGYYLVLSPLVKSWFNKNIIDLKKEFAINLTLYSEASQPEVIEYFNVEFHYEKDS